MHALVTGIVNVGCNSGQNKARRSGPITAGWLSCCGSKCLMQLMLPPVIDKAAASDVQAVDSAAAAIAPWK